MTHFPRAERAASDLFEATFGQAPARIVSAPGRLELLGNHTDYNAGLVLALAVDRHVHAAIALRADDRVRLVADAFPGAEEFGPGPLTRNPAAPWADYVKGVLAQLRERGGTVGGFDAAFAGDIPMGAGMSSSAALEVATALAVRAVFPYDLAGDAVRPVPAGQGAAPLDGAARRALARLCQAAENRFVGVQCGLLDQMSSLFGRADHALELDFQTLDVAYAPLPEEVAVVVCHSGVKHELTGGEYNELRAQCEAAARRLGVAVLRAVSPAQLKAARERLSVREFQCASHIVGENERVTRGVEALRTGDFETFGNLMLQSHASSRDDFRNSTPELDTLVELAGRQPGCLGARLTGGGFGGATINLVRRAHLGEFCVAMTRDYEARVGVRMIPVVCRAAEGAA